ncbi:MAG: ATP-binding protein [Anaerolineales bacterium]|nr:ATP-binding protein [Anaerolineales bacterium]
MRILSNTDLPGESPLGAGRPNCPICGGVGYLRKNVPVGDPEFGRVSPCVCMQGILQSQASERLYRFSNLDRLKHMTFESFSPRGRVALSPIAQKSLEQAYNLAYTFAQTRNGWLLLEGRFGCGKTHLAAAIANFSADHGIPTMFLTAPDLLDWLRASFEGSDERFSRRFEEIRQVPLLILDDFGTQNATPWAQEKLFQLLDYRYVNQNPTVITTNLRLEEIEGRIRSRLADSERVNRVRILAPDYRQPVEEMGSSELSTLSLHAKQTFAAFSLRESERLNPEDLKNLKKSVEYAKQMAKNPRGWLVLMGEHGCGKTHLAAAIANEREQNGFPALFVVVPDLLDHLRSTFNPTSLVSYDRAFEDIRTAHLLVLDDLGSQNTTPWAREKLFQLLNHRYVAELATVITTTSNLHEIDASIRMRLLDNRVCTILEMYAPSFHGGRLEGGAARKPRKARR